MSLLAHRLAIVLLLTLFGAIGHAEPVEAKPGPIVLPISGLALKLPADPRDSFTWQLSGSFSLSDDGFGYNGRDVLDEKVKGKLIAGTWIQVGYFDAGNCKATVAAADLTDSWADERELFGLRWCLRGGTYNLGSIGKVPAVVLCAHREGRKDLLLYRFLVDQPLGTPKEKLLTALGKSAAIERIAQAWARGDWATVKPRRRLEVRNRGSIDPARTMPLARCGLSLTLPDDGRVWLVQRPKKEDAVDWINLMAPALNEVTIEVIRVRATKFQTVFDSITAEKRYDAPPVNVPEGWTIGPTLVVDGKLERVIARQFGQDALLVGLFTVPDKGPGAGDFAPLKELLAALAAAAASR